VIRKNNIKPTEHQYHENKDSPASITLYPSE